MAKPTAHTQNAARANIHVNNLFDNKLEPFSDGVFVKECMDILVENICPEKICHYIVLSMVNSLTHS